MSLKKLHQSSYLIVIDGFFYSILMRFNLIIKYINKFFNLSKSIKIYADIYTCFQVADFGLAKLSSDTNTHISTRIMGTFG